MDGAECGHCGTGLAAPGPCPACGSCDRHIFMSDAGIIDTMELQARRGLPGQAWAVQVISEQIKWSGDRGRFERRRMLIDRENNHYVQEWSELTTGEATYRKEGPARRPRRCTESRRGVPSVVERIWLRVVAGGVVEDVEVPPWVARWDWPWVRSAEGGASGGSGRTSRRAMCTSPRDTSRRSRSTRSTSRVCGATPVAVRRYVEAMRTTA